MNTIFAAVQRLFNRRRSLVLAVVVLIGIVAGVGAGQPTRMTPGQLFDAMREPAVRIRVDYIVWNAQVKPEYQIEMAYTSSMRGIHQYIHLPAAQTELFIPWQQSEYLLPPSVWVQDGTIYCKAASTSQPGIAGLDAEFRFERACDKVFSVTLPGETKDLLDRSVFDGVTRIPNGYILKVAPQFEDTIVDVEIGVMPKLLSPMYFSLDALNRFDPNDKSRVVETVTSQSSFGTGLILPDAQFTALEYAERTSQGIRWTAYFAKQYENMTFMLTNEHVISPMLDGAIYAKYNDNGKAIWYAQSIVDAKAYVQLNPSGSWIELAVNGADGDLDLALVSTHRPLPKVPDYQFVAPGMTFVPGDTVYVAGHPLGMPTDIVTEGTLQSFDHVPNPGMPRWGRERYLFNIDARGGNSGSPAWTVSDGIPYVMGILHAGYGTRVETLGLETAGERFVGDMAFAPMGEFKLSGPLDIQPQNSYFIPADYHIIVTIDDIADFVFSQGIDIPALTERFDYLK